MEVGKDKPISMDPTSTNKKAFSAEARNAISNQPAGTFLEKEGEAGDGGRNRQKEMQNLC